MEHSEPLLLTDDQMRTFITEGFLILQTDFSKAFHDQLLEELNQVYEQEGNPGNNLLPRIRGLQKVFEHPKITGALTSVLGPDYMLHAHRHGHFNSSPTAGGWHKDSYWGYYRTRNHHPWWAMIMYFPQDTPIELGPTGVVPGSQYYETRIFEKDDMEGEARASGNAGTFALIHYDIWHRSTPNVLGTNRYMLKFEFMRTVAPSRPTWNNIEREWKLPESLSTPIPRNEVLWEENWHWLSGVVGGLAGTKAEALSRMPNSSVRETPGFTKKLELLTITLEASDEVAGLSAAYELACMGLPGIHVLLRALYNKQLMISRSAGYGLSISGREAVSGLITALNSVEAQTVVHAVFALGELRQLAEEALPALVSLLGHSSELVRRAVVEALGMIGIQGEKDAREDQGNQYENIAVNGLIQGLHDDDAQVRFMTGLALSRLGKSAETAIPHLEQAFNDENRYVRAHALEALRYIGSDHAKDILIKHLLNARWCPTTTKENSFYP